MHNASGLRVNIRLEKKYHIPTNRFRAESVNNQNYCFIIANVQSVLSPYIFAGRVCIRRPTHSTYATGTKELPVELVEGSIKSSDGGWDCAALSMLVMETVIV
jgi:hypothetical protein